MADRLFAAAASLILLGGGFAVAEEPPRPPVDSGSAANSSGDVLQNLRDRSSSKRWGEPTRMRRTPISRSGTALPGTAALPGDGVDSPAASRARVSRVNAIPIDGPATRRIGEDEEFGRVPSATLPVAPEVLSENEKANDAALPPAARDDAGAVPAPPLRSDNRLDDEGYRRPKTPSQLKRVTEILPYYDYEPDPELAKTDPCRNLCPRPDGCPGMEQLCPDDMWEDGVFIPRNFEDSLFTWAASNLYHNPLYFEDPALERYGHTWCEPVQPFVSVTRAGVQLVALPYQMGIDPICKKKYTLGWYRPGDCAPKLCYQPPLSVRGAIAEAGVVTGLFFLIP